MSRKLITSYCIERWKMETIKNLNSTVEETVRIKEIYFKYGAKRNEYRR